VYNMMNRWVERDLLSALNELGVGCIPFSPLNQGLLTNRYLHGIPADSRAGRETGFLKPERITPALLTKIRALDEVAREHGHGATLAQLAVRWLLRRPEITTVLIGASRIAQLDDIHAGIALAPLAADELARIETILAS
jgi:L-glyceraldehyde 3-phosphate reductase